MTEHTINTRAMPDLSMVRRWVGNSESWLNSFLASLPCNPYVVSVVVMGSAVRERGHRRSDFDLLVLYRGERPVFDAPVEVDVRAYPIQDLEKIASGHEIINWAMKYGTVLYDKEGIWRKTQTTWADRLPLPQSTEAALRAQRALETARKMLDAGDYSAADDLVLSALTQFVREKLIKDGVFPASRPELPAQLRSISQNDPLAQLLDDAMFGDCDASDLVESVEALVQPNH